MKLLKGLCNIVGGLIGILLILASPICIFGIIWNLMDNTADKCRRAGRLSTALQGQTTDHSESCYYVVCAE